jgi:hypothetical protein
MKVICALGLGVLTCAVPAHAAFDAVLCLSAKGSGTPKFRLGKPPAPPACKPTEIQIGHFDGTTLQFTGINVQIVSGSGSTEGAVNGKGNLIVGYNKGTFGQTRTGSHNLVVGDEHEYTSSAGLVAGFNNTLASSEASVTGGTGNTASAQGASVCGGLSNTASDSDSSVTGGFNNVAGAPFASVSGGSFNTASASQSSISGGSGLTQPAVGGWAAGTANPGNTVVGDFESP